MVGYKRVAVSQRATTSVRGVEHVTCHDTGVVSQHITDFVLTKSAAPDEITVNLAFPNSTILKV